MIVTFGLTLIAWIFFRVDSVSGAFDFIGGIFSPSLLTFPSLHLRFIWFFILILLTSEWIFREKQYGLQLNLVNIHTSFKWSVLMILCLIIFIFGNFNKTEFIYFAF